MIRHVVVFSWAEGTTPERVREFEDDLRSLPGQIDDIRDYRYGPDAGLVPGNGDFCLVADFDDEAGYRTYATHPTHVQVIERVRPIVARRMAVQLRL